MRGRGVSSGVICATLPAATVALAAPSAHLIRSAAAAGRYKVAFSARISGSRALSPGSYIATLSANNVGGKAIAHRLHLKIVGP